jgi:hypothetical protein
MKIVSSEDGGLPPEGGNAFSPSIDVVGTGDAEGNLEKNEGSVETSKFSDSVIGAKVAVISVGGVVEDLKLIFPNKNCNLSGRFIRIGVLGCIVLLVKDILGFSVKGGRLVLNREGNAVLL